MWARKDCVDWTNLRINGALMKRIWLLPVAFLALLLGGCATSKRSSTVAPDVDISSLQSFYVRKLPADERGVQNLIVAQLQEMGFTATTGASDEPLQPVDAIITYEDRWMWDITMYMLELKVKVIDPANEFPLAEGYTFRTSLVRKTPEEMVAEVLNEVFKKGK